MIQAMLNTVIGPWGRALIAFYFANQTTINFIFAIWAIIMTYGSVQLNKIRRHTVLMSVDALKQGSHLSNEQLWETFRPKWQEEIKQIKVRFILNRWNLWITKPTPELLIQILRLGPDWFEAIRNGEVLRYRFLTPGKNDRLSSFLSK